MLKKCFFEIPQVKEAAVIAIAGQPIAFIIARQAGNPEAGNGLTATQ